MIQQGEVYFVDFGKKHNSGIGKIRPAVVIQNNFLNRAINESIYKQVIVIPLTTVKENELATLKQKVTNLI